LNSPPRFLIIRLGSLGDIIHGIPAAAALRRHFPQAHIDWVVDPHYLELLNLVEGLDRRIPFSPRGLTGGGGAWSTLSELRAVRYDAVLDFQGLLKSAVLARLAGGRRTIGLPRAHLREPLAALFYSTTADPGAASHVIDKTLGLLAPLGVVDRPLTAYRRHLSSLSNDLRHVEDEFEYVQAKHAVARRATGLPENTRTLEWFAHRQVSLGNRWGAAQAYLDLWRRFDSPKSLPWAALALVAPQALGRRRDRVGLRRLPAWWVEAGERWLAPLRWDEGPDPAARAPHPFPATP